MVILCCDITLCLAIKIDTRLQNNLSFLKIEPNVLPILILLFLKFFLGPIIFLFETISDDSVMALKAHTSL